MKHDPRCPLEVSFIVRLLHLAHRLEHAANRCFFDPHGLSFSTGQILMCLSQTEGTTPTELTQRMGGKKSNMTQRIASLKKSGLVELVPVNDRDRRYIHVVLTEKGNAIAAEMKEIFGKHIQVLEQDISDEQKGLMSQSLNLIHTKLDSIECSHEYVK